MTTLDRGGGGIEILEWKKLFSHAFPEITEHFGGAYSGYCFKTGSKNSMKIEILEWKKLFSHAFPEITEHFGGAYSGYCIKTGSKNSMNMK